MKRHSSVKVNEEVNGTSTYVTLAIVMLVVVGLYTVLPPLMWKDLESRPISQSQPSDTSLYSPGPDQPQSSIFEQEQEVSKATEKLNEDKNKDKEDPLTVTTKYGSIRGTQRDGVRIFHGVRFAKPPLRDLRWREPQLVEPWGPEVYDATWVRPGCPQEFEEFFYPANGTSEDCLYLEIFAPFVQENKLEAAGLPVLVYLHGGGFKDMSASTPVFDSVYLAARGNMIVVLPDYRIGSLGFLFTGTSSDQAVGNFGLMDQKLAIQWIADNIKAFGGDPNKITLAGHSAGALSIVHHITDEETARHFHNVILSSIPLTNPYRSASKAIERGHTLARQLGCFPPQREEPDFVCLRSKSTDDIRDAEDSMVGTGSPALGSLLDHVNPWGPIVDGKLVKSEALDTMLKFASSDKTKIKPMIMGLTAEEGYLFLKQVSDYKGFGKFYLALLSSVTDANLSELSALYPVKNPNDVSGDIATALTDFMFRCPLRALQRRLVSHPHDGEKDMVKFWTYLWHPPMEGDLPAKLEFCQGKSCHGAELPFLFQNSDQLAHKPTTRQIKLSNALIDYMANFVATGDPNISHRKGFTSVMESVHHGDVAKSNPYWTPVTPVSGFSDNPTWLCNELNFMKNSVIKMSKRSKIKGQRCDMWDETQYKFPKIFGFR
ncbi:hypothetical protein EGW08_009735 [Elysia chlorotica]|uniref:Carboxylic ester hydrolase n=1 Tax=Elysia chlorotica TaxID=188477 RepID=A0A433TLX5_ELYCH|nr:hypothetical protein EGW08_009735 [Elysia chlorotica]